jgi:hypothetical protein
MKKEIFIKINNKKERGFALLMAVIVASTLLLVTYALTNISLKELTLSYTGAASQSAFYAADNGVECALFWDLKNPRGNETAFDTSVVNSEGINCNGNEIGNGGLVNTVPSSSTAVIGGGGNAATSTFQILTEGTSNGACAIVRVGKHAIAGEVSQVRTIIQSRGYNTCDVNNPRRLERALEVIY